MVSDAEVECDARRSILLLRGCVYTETGKSVGKSCGDVGEKLVRVVGFGALRDSGGFLLGLSIGGDNGNGVRLEKDCFPGPDVAYMFPDGEVTVDGGENGIVTAGHELICGLTGLDLSGLGSADWGILCGDGEGVDVVERKVGPGPADPGETGSSSAEGTKLSWGRGV